jgi:putative toxin-antitoxin system antitoxin component (TIGR02293 family)
MIMGHHARSLAALLGVKTRGEAAGNLDIAKAVSRGLSVDTAERLCGLIAPGDPKVRHLIAPKATLARRQRSAHRRLTVEEGNRLTRLARVWALAVEIWESEEQAQRFLAAPHPLLGGRVPRELAAETDIGAREVENLLGGLKYGTAV